MKFLPFRLAFEMKVYLNDKTLDLKKYHKAENPKDGVPLSFKNVFLEVETYDTELDPLVKFSKSRTVPKKT